MPPSVPGIGRYQFIISALINSAVAIYNGEQTRKQQERIAAENRKVAAETELNRQNFQRSVNAENAQAQRELSMQNHRLRIEEQENNYKLLCNQAEWQNFLKDWPLVNLPNVIRQEQLLADETIALRVIFSRCSDPVFDKTVYPMVEQGLREFTELYADRFGSKNLIFYHNAFKSTRSGGAVDKNIRYALRDLPVIIIDANVLINEIVVSVTMWGLGTNDDGNHSHTVYRFPYRQNVVDGKVVVNQYYIAIADQMLAALKLVLGFAYDTYNLVNYNRAPLLPRVAALELEEKKRAPILAYDELAAIMLENYGGIYDQILGTKESAFAQLPGSFQQLVLHELRMEYAEAAKNTISKEQFVQYLNESLDAWVNLRSDLPTLEFLQEILSDALPVTQYCNKEDRSYFEKLSGLYQGTNSSYSTVVVQICSKLASVDLEDTTTDTAVALSQPQPPKNPNRRILI